MHDCCGGLGQAQLIEQPAESRLAMCGAIAVKTWQRQSGAMPQPFLHAREQKSLFVDRQQHIEMLRGQQVLDESEKSGRVVAQSRTTMKFLDKAREPGEAPGTGIADLNEVTGQPEDRDRLPRRRAVALGNKHPERLLDICGIGHAGSFPPPTRLSCEFNDASSCLAPSARAAMHGYSWTNNRQPVISARPAGPLIERGVNQTWSTLWPHRSKPRRTHRCGRWLRFRRPTGSAISISWCRRCCSPFCRNSSASTTSSLASR